MKYCTRILTALVLGTALFTGVSYSADEKRKANKPVAKTDEELSFELDAAWKRRIAQLSLAVDHPLYAVAEEIGKQFPEVNFIVPEHARDTSVPGMTLKNVTLSEILKAIELASMGRIRTTGAEKTVSRVDPATGLPVPGAAAPQNIIGFMVSHPATRDVQPRPPTCQVFSLKAYLEGRSEKESEMAIKQLYEALEVAWEMMKKSGASVHSPQLSIHSGTKLLIAVGRDQELIVINQVVTQLQGSGGRTTVSASAQNEKSKPEAGSPNKNSDRP